MISSIDLFLRRDAAGTGAPPGVEAAAAMAAAAAPGFGASVVVVVAVADAGLPNREAPAAGVVVDGVVGAAEAPVLAFEKREAEGAAEEAAAVVVALAGPAAPKRPGVAAELVADVLVEAGAEEA